MTLVTTKTTKNGSPIVFDDFKWTDPQIPTAVKIKAAIGLAIAGPVFLVGAFWFIMMIIPMTLWRVCFHGWKRGWELTCPNYWIVNRTVCLSRTLWPTVLFHINGFRRVMVLIFTRICIIVNNFIKYDAHAREFLLFNMTLKLEDQLQRGF